MRHSSVTWLCLGLLALLSAAEFAEGQAPDQKVKPEIQAAVKKAVQAGLFTASFVRQT